MQSLIIISLENNLNSLIDILDNAQFGSNLLKKNENEYMLVQKKQFYKIDFADCNIPGFVKMKSDFLDFFAEIETKEEEVKKELLKYLNKSTGAINIFCERGFSEESYVLISKLAKMFNGIIFSGGVFLNSDHDVLLAFDGTTETNDFVGKAMVEEPVNAAEEEAIEEKEQEPDKEKLILEKVKSLKLVVSDKLPKVSEIQEIEFRDKVEICQRALVLTFIASYAEGVVETNEIKEIRKFFLNLLKEYNVANELTEAEMNFLYEFRPHKNQLVSFSWEYEGAYTLMWMLGFVEELSFPPTACPAHELVNIIKQYSTFEEFLAGSKMKPEKELLDAYELIYRTQRAVSDTQSMGRIVHGDLDLNVIKIRNKAFQWVTGYRRNLKWDKL